MFKSNTKSKMVQYILITGVLFLSCLNNLVCAEYAVFKLTLDKAFTTDHNDSSTPEFGTIQTALDSTFGNTFSMLIPGYDSIALTDVGQSASGKIVATMSANFTHLLDIEMVEAGLVLWDALDVGGWVITVDGTVTTVIENDLEQIVPDASGNSTLSVSLTGDVACAVYDALSKCLNAATCSSVVGRPRCVCADGYCGMYCETPSSGPCDDFSSIDASGDGDSGLTYDKIASCPDLSSDPCTGSDPVCTSDFACDGDTLCCGGCCKSPVTIPDSTVLLFADGGLSYGRLELSYNGEQRTVCDVSSTWSVDDTDVACQNVNPRFTSGGYTLDISDFTSSSALEAYLKDVDCRGDETQLVYCRTSGLNNVDTCAHTDDVALFCYDYASVVTVEIDITTTNIASTFWNALATVLSDLYPTCTAAYSGNAVDLGSNVYTATYEISCTGEPTMDPFAQSLRAGMVAEEVLAAPADSLNVLGSDRSVSEVRILNSPTDKTIIYPSTEDEAYCLPVTARTTCMNGGACQYNPDTLSVYCSCVSGYVGDYCQQSVSYDESDFILTTTPEKWFNGRYVWYSSKTNNLGQTFYMHESGQAFIMLISSTTWRLVEYTNIENAETTTTLYTGTVSNWDKFNTASWTRANANLPLTITFTAASVLADTLLPWGIPNGDMLLLRNSAGRVSYQYFPSVQTVFFRETTSSFYVSDRGYISVNEVEDVATLPNPATATRDYKLIAPFLGYMDAHCDGSSVFYKDCINSDTVTDAMQILTDSGVTSFTAIVCIKVTWFNLAGCDYSSKGVTFQTILLGSANYMYAIYNYRLGGMVGTPSVSPNYRGYLQSYLGDNNAEYKSVVDTNYQLYTTNEGMRQIYSLITTAAPQTPCALWYDDAFDVNSLTAEQLNNLPSCACTQDQMITSGSSFKTFSKAKFYDSSFDSLPQFYGTDSDLYCYASMPRSTVSHKGDDLFLTQACCYDKDSGALLQSVGERGSVILLNKNYPVSGIDKDKTAFSDCCEDGADLCSLFYNFRPSDDCTNFVVPKIAVNYGDPHIVTLDGLSYTFNGLGEYDLLTKDGVMRICARTGAVTDDEGNIPASNPTSFVAVSMKHADYDTQLQIAVDPTLETLKIYCRNATVVTSVNCDDWTDMSSFIQSSLLDLNANEEGSVYITKLNQNDVTAIFGAGTVNRWEVEVIRSDTNMLQIHLTVPSTADGALGLMGKANGDSTDDFMRPDLTTIPASSSTEDIFYEFGEKWRVDVTEVGCFCYPNGQSWADYNNVSWIPSVFDPPFSNADDEANAIAVCGSDQACLMDVASTNNLLAGVDAVSTLSNFVADVVVLANTPPFFMSPIPELQCTLGTEASITLSTMDSDAGDVLTLTQTGGIGTGTLTGNTFAYTAADLEPVKFTFTVTDSGGAAAVVSPTVKVCSGCVNGVCNWAGSTQDSNITTFSLTPCLCETGWTGSDCNTDYNGCDPDPCPLAFAPDSVCTDLSPSEEATSGSAFNCSCVSGFTSDPTGCVDIDECTLDTDDCEMICINSRGNYSCSCNLGYTLADDLRTCNDVDECIISGSNNCTQECINTEGSYNCSCYSGYTLQDDGFSCVQNKVCTQIICDQICEISGSGVAVVETCKCQQGYTLDSDNTTCLDVDECSALPSPCAQNCNNTDGGFFCSCNAGYTLDNNGATCTGCATGLWGEECANACVCGQNVITCDAAIGCTGCVAGWEGTNCLQDINECLSVSCPDNANCINTQGSYSCSCNAGFSFDANQTVCSDIDECASYTTNECMQNCVNTIGGHNCSCNEGFTLQEDGLSCLDINECTEGENPCLLVEQAMSGLCYNIAPTSSNNFTKYECRCFTGYQSSGKNCVDIDECNSGTVVCAQSCVNMVPGYTCNCFSGYKLAVDGTDCVDIDECLLTSLNDCQFHSQCVNTDGNYTCSCPSGYTDNADGFNCDDIDECATASANQCQYSDLCNNIPGSYECGCPVGYTNTSNGFNCQDKDECSLGTDNCDVVTSTCQNAVGSFTCGCNSGYEKDSLDTCVNVDECADQISDCEQICTDTTPGYNCSCQSGFTLQADGTTCQSDGSNICVGKTCDYQCGGDGACFCRTGYTLDADGETCDDIDECAEVATNLCSFPDECANTDGNFNCSCPAGYLLDNNLRDCEDVNECLGAQECEYTSLCNNTVGSYTCACPEGYELQGDGLNCQDVDECSDPVLNLCQEKALCGNTAGSFTCNCSAGFALAADGFSCQDIDECAAGTDDCSPIGVAICTNDIGSFTCSCPPGYTIDAANKTCSDINECTDGSQTCSPSDKATCSNTDGGYTCICADTWILDTANSTTCLNGLPYSGGVVTAVSLTTNHTFNASNVATLIPQYQTVLDGVYSAELGSEYVGVTVDDIVSGSTVILHTVELNTDLGAAGDVKVVQALQNYLDRNNGLTLGGEFGIALSNAQLLVEDTNGNTVSLDVILNPCLAYDQDGSCLNGAECRVGNGQALCFCTSGWSGTYCDTVAEDTDMRTLIVALSTVGGILLLLAIMVVILVMYHNRSKRRQQRNAYLESDTSSSGGSPSDMGSSTIRSRMNFRYQNWYQGFWPNAWGGRTRPPTATASYDWHEAPAGPSSNYASYAQPYNQSRYPQPYEQPNHPFYERRQRRDNAANHYYNDYFK